MEYVQEMKCMYIQANERGSLSSGDITSENLGVDPVTENEETVTEREELRNVSRTPEVVGGETSGREVTLEEGKVGDSLVGSDVGKRTLVGVREGRDVAGTDDSVGERVELSGFSVRRLGRVEVSEKSILLVELREDASEVTTLLRGDLGSGSVVGSSAVTEGEDTFSSEEAKVFVNEETSSRVLLLRNLVHQILGDLTSSVTSGPNKETVRVLNEFLLFVLSDESFLFDFLDHSLGGDVDLVLLEGRHGVVNELLREHGKNVGEGFDQGDLDAGSEFRVPVSEILLEEIVKFTSVLDTSWSTSDNNEVKETVNLSLSLSSKVGSFDTVHNPSTNLLGIPDFLEEASVLLDSLDTESLVLSSDSVNEVVVGDFSSSDFSLDLRVVKESNSLLLGINFVNFSLVNLSLSLHVSGKEAGRLKNGTSSESTDGNGRKERSEEEVVARGDDNDVVASVVEFFEES